MSSYFYWQIVSYINENKNEKFENSNTDDSVTIAQKEAKYFENFIMSRKYNLLV